MHIQGYVGSNLQSGRIERNPPPLGILPGTYGVLTVSDRQAPRGVPGGNWGDPEYGMIKTSPEGSRQLGKGHLKKYAALGQFGIRKRG